MNRRQLIVIAGVALLAVFTLALKCGEDPPTVPVLTPPTGLVYQNAEIPLRVVATQPQDKNIRYVVNWGDGKTDTSAIDYPSGTDATLRHIYPNPGDYQVKALAFVADKPELASDWSDEITLSILANQAPTDVRITWPDRPVQLARNRDSRFEAVATDPEGDSVQYQFSFGDGNQSSWTSPLVPSGAPDEVFHRYRSLGTYYVKARARDQKGSISGWSDSLRIVVDTTGVLVWAWVTPDEDEGPAIGSALVLMRNEEPVIYVGAEDEAGRFYGIRAATGRHVVRSISTDEDYYTGHPAYVAASGNIIAGCENGELYAFNLGLTRQWRWPDSSLQWTDYIEWGVPAINGRRIYHTRDRSRHTAARLYCLVDNTSSVSYAAHRDVPGIKNNPVINAAGEVIVVTDAGRLLVLDGNNLSPAWDTVLTGGAALTSPTIGAGGHIYVGDVAGNVYCINPDRTIRWKVQVDGEANRIVLGTGSAFVTTGRGRVYRLNPETGGTVWNVTLYDPTDVITSPILTANGLIYIHDDQDVLTCLKQDDGSEVWRIELEEFAPARSGRRRSRDFENPEGNPALTPDGDIVVVGLDALYLVAGYSDGTLMPSSWPKWQGGVHNAGKVGGF